MLLNSDVSDKYRPWKIIKYRGGYLSKYDNLKLYCNLTSHFFCQNEFILLGDAWNKW